MKILVTGAYGFIGKNLIAELRNRNYETIISCGRDMDEKTLKESVLNCDFIFHLAGVNRPKREEEFMEGNSDFTKKIISFLEEAKKNTPVLMSSSTQAALENPYGISKKSGEEILKAYAERSGAKVMIYRLPNVFGKWGKPDYNSVIATFCYHVGRGEAITINNPDAELNLVYIDDVVNTMIEAMEQSKAGEIQPVYQKKLGEIATLIQSFPKMRNTLEVPMLSDEFEKKLYSTYLSYLPEDAFSYPLTMHTDQRGSFTEFIRTPERGQVSINVSKPGIVKGNHWHHTKNEKFLVVKGQGLIQFRQIGSEEIFEYQVSGDKLEVVDVPCGYTHNIINTGTEDMVTVMWANEAFDPEHPDTFYGEV